jgi:hypothetical protein
LEFVYSEAIYYFVFNQFSLDENRYSAMIRELLKGSNMNQLTSMMKSQDLALNAILWTSYVRSYVTGNTVQYFSLSGEATFAFNTQFRTAVIASPQGTCSVVPRVQYNTGDSLTTISFSYSEFMNDQICANSINLNNAGYFGTSDLFELSFDVRSFSTAIAGD